MPISLFNTKISSALMSLLLPNIIYGSTTKTVISKSITSSTVAKLPFLRDGGTGMRRIDTCISDDWTELANIPGIQDREDWGKVVRMSADGSTLVIGTSRYDVNGDDNNGRVTVYRRDASDQYVQLGLTIYGQAGDQLTGESVDGLVVSADGNMFGITSYRADDKFVAYQLVGGNNWEQIGQGLIGEGGQFGAAAAMSADGRIVAIGANTGDYVNIYELDISDQWVKEARIDIPLELEATVQANEYSMFGSVIDITPDGGTFVTSAQTNDNFGYDVGYTVVFEKDSSNNWVMVGDVIPGDVDGHRSSNYVAISDDGLTIAAGDMYGGIDSQGLVKVWGRNSSNHWDQVGSTLYGENAYDYFGNLQMSGDGKVIIVKQLTGPFYVYQRDSNDNWLQVGQTMYESGGDRKNGAVTISGDGSIIAVGSPNIVGNGGRVGEVNVFQSCGLAVPDPTELPSANLSSSPSMIPSFVPSSFPSKKPSSSPSDVPSVNPSSSPSMIPSFVPSSFPTKKPSASPSDVPSKIPSLSPTASSQPSISPFSWDLELDEPGYLKNPPIQDGIQEFVSKYNISDRAYTIQVFKDDCSTLSSGLPLNATVDSKSGGKNHLEIVLLYNQSMIQESNLWSGNLTGGDVDFCVTLGLYTNASNGTLFNFIETVYKIEVDFTTGFSTTVDVVRTESGNGGVEIIDINENITVYQCSDTYDRLTTPSALTQGDFLQMCVETTDDSVFEVGEIKDVIVSQNNTRFFDYVKAFVDSYWAVSSCMAINSTLSKCKVKMQLLGEYFTDDNPTNLTVTGFVKLDYVGRRLLNSEAVADSADSGDNMKKKRNLLNTNNLEGAKFTMDVSLSGSEIDEEEEGGFLFDDETVSGAYSNMLYGSIIFGLPVVVTAYVMSINGFVA